jgi:tetratricopeptide (TPR) repeat protein
MDLLLALQNVIHVKVTCDGQDSHTFDLSAISPLTFSETQDHPADPIHYGTMLYHALFRSETLASQSLAAAPERIVLVASDPSLDAIAWEYLYGPTGFLVQECHVVRALPPEQRIQPVTLNTGLHIVAIPSNPLSSRVAALNIDAEWQRLTEMVNALPFALTLERTRPPTLKQLRTILVGQHSWVVHFMGHGGQQSDGAILSFEKDNGDLDLVEAKDFAFCVRGTTFLVTLNACDSAAPGDTSLSNLASTLVRQKIPYALGMRFRIPDPDALLFSRTFYTDLVSGSSVEEALLQARLTLARESPRPWVVGVPVLYTSLATPTAGFVRKEGRPIVLEHQPRKEVSALPRAEGLFQGRREDLLHLGTVLTGDNRPRILTLHGGGGQGKTALAREVIERFAFAWPGGVWAASLETLPTRALFAADFARFLGIKPQEIGDPQEVERQILARLAGQRTLIVLDNAETLVDAVEAENPAAIHLGQFLQQLPSASVSLLVTSRVPLGWVGETIYDELGGLSPKEGVLLFAQCAPQKVKEGDHISVWEISKEVEGHPLSLRLLGSAFNASTITLNAFRKEYTAQLMNAQNKYRDGDHRHRSLSACIDISVRYLNSDLRALFSGLRIFHAPFQAQTAVALFDPEGIDTEDAPSLVREQLDTLWQRSLLTRKMITVRDGTLQFYHLLPTTRPYIEQYMPLSTPYDELLTHFGAVHAGITHFLYTHLDRSASSLLIVQQTQGDLERAGVFLPTSKHAIYNVHWASILSRVGTPQRSLHLLEEALEYAQEHDLPLAAQALTSMAKVYNGIGQPQRALDFYEQALPITCDAGNRKGEASILTSIAEIYNDLGQPQRALRLYEQALPITREVGDRAGEAVTLNSLALMHYGIGQSQQALSLYEQALPIMREVGNRAGESSTLNNQGLVYHGLGQLQPAVDVYEQALPIMREMGNRAGEASTLNNLARAYHGLGLLPRALRLYEQALLVIGDIGDRAREAAALTNMALVYHDIGQSQRALELSEEALPIIREVGDRSGESTLLNNMALVYHDMGQPQQALRLYEQALPIMREVGNRAGEAATVHNLARIYHDMGQSQQALRLYEQALLLTHDVGDRAGEATTLANMARVYHDLGQTSEEGGLLERALLLTREVGNRVVEAIILTNLASVYVGGGQLQQALNSYEQALSLLHEVGDNAREIMILINMAVLLYQYMQRHQDALHSMQQALNRLKQTGQSQTSGGQTQEELQRWLKAMDQGVPLFSASESVAPGLGQVGEEEEPRTEEENVLEFLIAKTLAVLGPEANQRQEWREMLVQLRDQTIEQRVQDLFNAMIALLDTEGNPASLGTNLTGGEAQVWQEIVARLSVERG